jgi:aspartate 1-decarboxylase
MYNIMQRIMLKSKIHNAGVTQADLSYTGSITIDGEVMDRADIFENERVQVVNLNNGARFETYAIRGGDGSGVICLNGPAARMGLVGDRVHILSYALMNEEEVKRHTPKILMLDERNRVSKEK